PRVEVGAGRGPDAAVGVLIDPDAPRTVTLLQHRRPLLARAPELTLAGPAAGEARTRPVPDVLRRLVLGERVVRAAGLHHVRVDVVVAEPAHRHRPAP